MSQYIVSQEKVCNLSSRENSKLLQRISEIFSSTSKEVTDIIDIEEGYIQATLNDFTKYAINQEDNSTEVLYSIENKITGEIVGGLLLETHRIQETLNYPEVNYIFINYAGIQKQYRGRSMTRLLHDKVEETARDLAKTSGLDSVVSTYVHEDNTASINACKARGYTEYQKESKVIQFIKTISAQ